MKANPILKILWFSPYLIWPTHGGNRVRQYQLLRHLAERGHRITLLIQSKTPMDEDTKRHLGAVAERVIVLGRRAHKHPLTLAAALLAPYPIISSVHGLSRPLRAKFAELLEEPWDVVQVEHSYGLQSFLPLLLGRRQPFVLTEHNVESTLVATANYHPRIPKPAMWLLRHYDGWRFRRWERRALRAPTRVIAVTQQDAAVMERIAGRSIDVVPNGADTTTYADVHPDAASRRIMFIANYGYPPNNQAVEWAVSEIMPRVWRQVPDARFAVCGSGMPAHWPQLWPDPRIEWRGFVADIKVQQRESAVFIAPLRAGGGSKLKVLEAMSAGLAVVSTAEGVSGLAARDGIDYLAGQTAQELADALSALLLDPERSRILGENGRDYVRGHHGWAMLAEQLEQIYSELPPKP
ncbi:MAG: glycosyltransferase family 4 protein [Gammaproteobacteria bacterium]